MLSLDRIKIYLRYVRWREIIFFSGIPLLGALFSTSALNPKALLKIGLLIAAVFLTGSHVWLWNNLWGLKTDRYKYNKRRGATECISFRELFILSFLPLGLGIFSYFALPQRTFLMGMITVLILDIYSGPPVFLKGRPGYSSLVHLIAGTLFFLVGYSLFRPVGLPALLLGLYFGLVFMAGHLNHEIEDYEADREARIFTNAVKFGKRRVFFYSLGFFTLSSIYFYLLGYYAILPQLLAILPLLIYPFHLYFLRYALKEGLTSESVSRFRKNYRWLYAIIGCVIILYLVEKQF